MNRQTFMTLESAFARAFNIARGMVSPYVATEVSARIALHRNFATALSDRKAADIMARVLSSPKAVSRRKIYAHSA